MIDGIIEAMATTIAGLYPDCTIYTEPVEQDLQEPAFYIHCINVDQSDLIARRFRQSMPFEVVYFPREGLSEINNTLPTLLVYLRQITLKNGQRLNGRNIKGQIIEGILRIFVDYDITVKIATDTVDNMGKINITGGTNG